MDSNREFKMIQRDSDSEISIAWSNIRYVSKSLFGERKVILRGLTGHCRYQTVNAVLGPSGAGKTTLLNCLNGQLQSGLSEQSSIYLNHNEPNEPLIRFIQQHVHETMFPLLTVKETLAYAFRFKNKLAHFKHFEKHLQQVLPQLLLDTAILGQRLQVCSGGQIKRIAIAQELMSIDQPSFLFVDEPTTGLDSHSAYIVMKCIRLIANQHRITVLVSLHTPNSDIMSLLDKVYILSKGGLCIYSGPPAYLRENLKERINVEFGEQKPPIEEYLRIACNGITDKSVLQLSQYTLENEHKVILDNIDGLKFMAKGITVNHKSFLVGDFLIQFQRMFNLVFVKGFKEFFLTFLSYSLILLFCETFFEERMLTGNTCKPINQENINLNETCGHSINDHDNSTNYIIFLACHLFILGVPITCLSAVLFGPKIQVFKNEHRNRWYSMSVFYWSVTIVYLIHVTIFSILIIMIAYFAKDHRVVDNGEMNWIRFFSFALFLWFCALYMQSVGQLISLVFMDYKQIALIAALSFYTFVQIFDGYNFPIRFLKDRFMRLLLEITSLQTISRGLLYSFYGIDRCDPKTEISFVITTYDIDPDSVYWELWRIVLIIALIRGSTILLMAVRFSWKFNKKTFIQTTELKPIDCCEKNQNPISEIVAIERIKSNNEEYFEKFSTNKFIIGWRSLTLFASNSIYEMRSVNNVHQSSKMILRNLNGQFCFGTINAVMGTSGAGKTSLLKVLNGRMKAKLSSECHFYLSKYTPIQTCYITQQVSGHLLPGLTAKQSLIYASRLKNALLDSEQIDHTMIADNILRDLDMADAADTLVTRCSGGEQKRLALGLELTSLRMPNLICIDEPTSGLDSNTAQLVIACLHRLAKRHNLTIVTSIHQPNTDVLMMFDEVYILANGGVCIYSGPPNNIQQHLTQVDIGQTSQQNNFPVEQLVKYSCLKHSDEAVKILVKKTTPQILQHDEQLMRDTQLVLDGIQPNRTRFSIKSIQPMFVRSLIYMKNFGLFPLGFFTVCTISFAYTLSKFGGDPVYSGCHSLDEDFSNCTLIREEEMAELVMNFHYQYFAYTIFVLVFLLESAVLMFLQFPLLKIEHRNGWYSIGVFYFVESVIEFLPKIPLAMIYVYLVDNTHSIRPEIYYYMVMATVLISLPIQALGHICSILCNGRITMLCYMIPSLIVFYELSCGCVTPIPNIHHLYQAMAYPNLLRYQNEIALLLLYGFGRCKPREIQLSLHRLGIENDDYFYECIFRMVILAIFYRCLAVFLLYYKFNPYQNHRERAQRITAHHKTLKRTNAVIPGLSCHQEFTIKQIQI